MNLLLPCGDRHHRSPTSGRPPRCRGAGSRLSRLMRRDAADSPADEPDVGKGQAIERTRSLLAGSANIQLAKRCLRLIQGIAKRGASSRNPVHIGYALQELSQVLLERTGIEDRVFEPVSASELGNLSALYEELVFVACASSSMASSDRQSCRSDDMARDHTVNPVAGERGEAA